MIPKIPPKVEVALPPRPQKPICFLCAKEAGRYFSWLVVGTSFNIRGTCACCGYISATVTIAWNAR